MIDIRFQKAEPMEGFMCADMHVHTTHSDGMAYVDDILNIIRKKNFCVAITDHTEISGVLEAYEKKKNSDIIIPGIEVMAKNGFDVLFYFYDLDTLKKFFYKEIRRNRIPIKRLRNMRIFKTRFSIMEILKFRKKYNCLVSLAHPYGYTLRAKPLDIEKQKDIFKYADAVEVINGGNNHPQNKKAVALREKAKAAYTGGSDGHSVYAIGSVLTCSKAKSIKEFLGNIKNQKNIVIGKEPFFGRKTVFFYYFLNKIKNEI